MNVWVSCLTVQRTKSSAVPSDSTFLTASCKMMVRSDPSSRIAYASMDLLPFRSRTLVTFSRILLSHVGTIDITRLPLAGTASSVVSTLSNLQTGNILQALHDVNEQSALSVQLVRVVFLLLYFIYSIWCYFT